MLVNVSDTDQNDLPITVRNFAPTGTVAIYRADAGHAPAASTPAVITDGSVTGLSLAKNSSALVVLSK